MARMGEKCVRSFYGEARGKRPLGRPMRRWEDANKDPKNRIRGCGLDSLGSGYELVRALVNTKIETSNAIKRKEYF